MNKHTLVYIIIVYHHSIIGFIKSPVNYEKVAALWEPITSANIFCYCFSIASIT